MLSVVYILEQSPVSFVCICMKLVEILCTNIFIYIGQLSGSIAENTRTFKLICNFPPNRQPLHDTQSVRCEVNDKNSFHGHVLGNIRFCSN